MFQDFLEAVDVDVDVDSAVEVSIGAVDVASVAAVASVAEDSTLTESKQTD